MVVCVDASSQFHSIMVSDGLTAPFADVVLLGLPVFMNNRRWKCEILFFRRSSSQDKLLLPSVTTKDPY